MYIRKQRLLTPGPTPLYPPALHAMMASDIHHRTEDFRKVYRSCLADLKEVSGDKLVNCGSIIESIFAAPRASNTVVAVSCRLVTSGTPPSLAAERTWDESPIPPVITTARALFVMASN